MIKDYEMVIGLEVHCELGTKTKIFCGCPTTFGAEPNTQCCPVCMGMPGTLPVLNKQVVEYAIKAGIATNCTIAEFSKQDRKNYFYPDLPKAYQISQYDLPLCEHGWLEIEGENGAKKIGITRIHIEEDAGKLIHNDEYGTMVDCNRCGVPLIEIVSEPDIRSAEEAIAYFKKLRAIILYTGISDCKMQEGSMRCDVNFSVRKKGTEKFGTRTEMKNLNSFTFIQKAIEYEYKRQVEEIEKGGTIVQETRRYDQNSGKTYSMRKKEDANDYRYFPDPDLAPIVMSRAKMEEIKNSIPTLPDERKKVYVGRYGLTPYDAELITNDLSTADYFEEAAKNTEYPKILANLIISEIMKLYDSENGEITVEPLHMAQIAQMQGSGEINSSVARKVVKALWENDEDAAEYVKRNDLAQINDEGILRAYIKEAIEKNPKSIEDYKKGKTAAAKAIMGQVMGRTQGRGNPILIDKLLTEALESLKQ
ncbi:MAG: Asp-tRNA(Asn)/Glu-tRNA(Gln) amidotransferase subunit GatB [Clostridiales bacterium]|nr:Asp-tRNA(Asn)/Glu-tRNA(Gln) amidotransferase subunit GatB [Clostridiales bacterium]